MQLPRMRLEQGLIFARRKIWYPEKAASRQTNVSPTALQIEGNHERKRNWRTHRRRCSRPDKTSVTHIRGCYVNEKGEILSEFTQALSLMTEDEAEKMLALLGRKALSGSYGEDWWTSPSPPPRSRTVQSTGS